MDATTVIEVIGICLGGSGIIGFLVGIVTFKWKRLKEKSEAKGAEAEADMKRQDYYQEVIDDLKKDRERMKEIREEQESYIKELREDRHRLREEKESLRMENDDLRKVIADLRDTQSKQGDKIARLGRIVENLKPLICANVNCNMRQADIMGLVADDSFDIVKEAKDNTKKKKNGQ